LLVSELVSRLKGCWLKGSNIFQNTIWCEDVKSPWPTQVEEAQSSGGAHLFEHDAVSSKCLCNLAQLSTAVNQGGESVLIWCHPSSLHIMEHLAKRTEQGIRHAQEKVALTWLKGILQSLQFLYKGGPVCTQPTQAATIRWEHDKPADPRKDLQPVSILTKTAAGFEKRE
jgi:hypothetical protein